MRHMTTTLLLLATLAAGCRDKDGDTSSDEPAAWGELCEYGEPPCDVGLKCLTSRPDMTADVGLCVETCNDDVDCTQTEGHVWRCFSGRCSVGCMSDEECPQDFDIPMGCYPGNYCLIK